MYECRIDREKWAKLTIYEQLGNIGSEVGRAISAKRAGYDYRIEGAVVRAQDLFSATIEVLIKEKTHLHRAKEILRARDQFISLFYDGEFDDVEAAKIENYFMNYAYIARTQVLEQRESRGAKSQIYKGGVNA